MSLELKEFDGDIKMDNYSPVKQINFDELKVKVIQDTMYYCNYDTKDGEMYNVKRLYSYQKQKYPEIVGDFENILKLALELYKIPLIYKGYDEDYETSYGESNKEIVLVIKESEENFGKLKIHPRPQGDDFIIRLCEVYFNKYVAPPKGHSKWTYSMIFGRYNKKIVDISNFGFAFRKYIKIK